jgi:uncharacterized paraquat-inducible protein A
MKKDGPKEMEVKPALALPDGLELVACERSDDVLTMIVVSTQQSPCCPRCGTPARRVHSRYTRPRHRPALRRATPALVPACAEILL